MTYEIKKMKNREPKIKFSQAFLGFCIVLNTENFINVLTPIQMFEFIKRTRITISNKIQEPELAHVSYIDYKMNPKRLRTWQREKNRRFNFGKIIFHIKTK